MTRCNATTAEEIFLQEADPVQTDEHFPAVARMNETFTVSHAEWAEAEKALT